MKKFNLRFILVAAFVLALNVFAQESALLTNSAQSKILLGELLYKDDFNRDLSRWVVEQAPEGTTRLVDGRLDIDDAGGCTVWFKEKLSGPITVEFEVVMVKAGGAHDRGSDLNCFWMATDPAHPEDIFYNSKQRGGYFKKYDLLRLYYVGCGANDNKTTRFRRYPGDGTRPLLAGMDLSEDKFMNTPNKKVKISIVADGNRIQFQRDGEVVFDFKDKEPFRDGWFAFRTVRNHMTIGNFRVHRLVH